MKGGEGGSLVDLSRSALGFNGVGGWAGDMIIRRLNYPSNLSFGLESQISFLFEALSYLMDNWLILEMVSFVKPLYHNRRKLWRICDP